MGVFDTTSSLLRRLGPLGEVPAFAVDLSGRGFSVAERMALQLLQARMEAVIPSPRTLLEQRPEASRAARAPAEVMAGLLTRSLEQNTIIGQSDYYLAVLRQLVPDEARIVAALAERGEAPVVMIYQRGSKEAVLEYASLIGRSAAVTVPSMTPRYVAHLVRLGISELGRELDDSRGYELVLAEKQVREALKEGGLGKLPARVERRSVRLSPHGRDFWEQVRPSGEAFR